MTMRRLIAIDVRCEGMMIALIGLEGQRKAVFILSTVTAFASTMSS